jgi:hypothetical protein
MPKGLQGQKRPADIVKLIEAWDGEKEICQNRSL